MKIFRGRIPPDPPTMHLLSFSTQDNAPPPPPPTRYNKPSYGPDNTDRKGREEAIVSVLSSVQIKQAVRKKGRNTCYI